MDSRQAHELLESLKGAGSIWSWTLHPKPDDLNAVAHEADLIGTQVGAFIFQRIVDGWEKQDHPYTVQVVVDVDTGSQHQKGFTCPKCSRTSYNPNDERWGYCGACHAFTDPRDTTRVGGSEPTDPT